MNRILNWISLVFLLMLTSCVAEELWDQNVQTGRYTYVFEGSNVSDTKISIGDKTDGRWPILWEKGDVLGVFRADGTFVGSAAIDEGYAGKTSAKFTVSSSVELIEGETVHFVYPYSSDVEFSDGTFSGSIKTEQTMTAPGSSAGIGNSSLAYAEAVYEGETTGFVLSYANSYLKVKVSPGEFGGYDLKGLTLWSKGQNVSGLVALDVEDGTVEAADARDYVEVGFRQPVLMERDKSYSFWVSALPGDFTGKELYMIVHMTKDDETVTLPILVKGAGKLPKQTVTNVSLPAFSRSLSPSWYEPVEKRYIAAYGKGWAYGAQNTVLFSQSNVVKTVEFKARGNFMKVVEPKYIQVVYSSDLLDTRTSGTVYIGGSDSYSGGAHRVVALDSKYSQTISIVKYYGNGAKGGHLSAMYVMDKDKNVIWGTNLWLAVNPFVETQYANGKVLDRNIGSDGAIHTANHWTCNGCYFQWGRPWAFPWTVKITGTRISPVDPSGSLDKSAANPYTFIYHAGEPFDWFYGDGSSTDRSGDMDDLWGNPNRSSSKNVASSGVKSIYDPCPEGYMVVSPSVLAELESGVESSFVDGANIDYIRYKGVSWGFVGGYLGTVSGSSLNKSGNGNNTSYEAAYWSNSNCGSNGLMFSYRPSVEPHLAYDRERTAALPVRCMVEQRNAGGSGGSSPSLPGEGGSTGGEIEDDGRPQIPEDFEEEPDDMASDPVGSFDYSLLADAGHPRLLTDAQGFADLKRKVTTERMSNETLYRLHSEVMARARKIVSSNKTFNTSLASSSDYYTVVDNLLSCTYAYRMTGLPSYLTKVRTDISKVCSMSDWEPSGLAIGEISMAMGLTYDWLYYDLTLAEREAMHEAMVEKGIRPMYNNNNNINIVGNWNQINLGGVSVASMAIYEKDKDIAVKQMEKAVSGNYKGVTGIYKPNGNYAEGLGYWEYGGGYEACYLACLKGVFGNTAGIAEIPGYMDSGEYALFMHGTMNTTFTYNDGGGTKDPVLLTSWWHAAMKNDPTLIYCEKRRLYDESDTSYKNTSTTSSELPYRLLAPTVVMLRDFDMDSRPVNPPTREVWSGQGEKPVAMVRRGWKFDESDVFLGIVGGLADAWETSRTAHGHMDAGSFVFEAEGVRWSDDIMRPSYGPWNDALRAKESPRKYTAQEGVMWDTFHVSNLCHSTIVSYTNDGSVNGKLHSSDYNVDGYASIDQTINTGTRQGAVVNLTAPMKGQVKSAKRTVELVNGTDLVVTDEITALDGLDCRLEWRMLSMSSSTVASDGVTLSKNGKTRKLTATSDNSSAPVTYKSWPTTKPTGDGWGVLNFHQDISDRTIAGWTATVPAGKKVTFVTTLKR